MCTDNSSLIDSRSYKMNSFKGTGNNDKIIKIPSQDYVPDPRGVGYVFFTNMQKHKDKIAQIDGQTGEIDSYGSLLQRCIRTAITMRSKGVAPGDIITLCTFNHLDACVPFFATFLVGGTVASLDPTLSLTDTIDLLKQVTPKLIFVVPEAVEMVEKAVEEVSPTTSIVVFGNTTKHIPFADFLRPSPEEDNFKPFETKNAHDTAVIFFSSGTSGLPKGICISHFAFLGQIVNLLFVGYCTDVVLAYASFYWVTATVLWGICIFNGSARLILPEFDHTVIWEKIDKYKPTMMFLAPNQILAMCYHGHPDGLSTSSLKDVAIIGGPVHGQQIMRLWEIFPGTRVCLTYGQTEAGFLAAFKPAIPEEMDFIPDKPASCGRGFPGISYKIVDPETEEVLGPNQEGELRVKTPFHLNGYHNLDSSSVWDAHGWVKTGDVAYYDEDLCFYIVDRIKELLKFQSWHVPPAVLQNLLLTHPAIETAVVIGIPHEIDGDHPMAVVALKEPFIGRVTPEEIVRFVEQRVHDRHRLRGGVRIVEELPITPTGKVKRRVVKEMILKSKVRW